MIDKSQLAVVWTPSLRMQAAVLTAEHGSTTAS